MKTNFIWDPPLMPPKRPTKSALAEWRVDIHGFNVLCKACGEYKHKSNYGRSLYGYRFCNACRRKKGNGEVSQSITAKKARVRIYSKHKPRKKKEKPTKKDLLEALKH